MKRSFLAFALTMVVTMTASANLSADLVTADELQESERYEEQMRVLETALGIATSSAERAQVYWRMSRASLGIGDLAKDAGRDSDSLISIYEEAERYADQAIAADPADHNGYFYKSANIGKAGQVRGILNSLFAAAPMRDLLKETITRDADYAAAYYVLGQLYGQVPGVISFGNDDYAVSFARKSIDLHEAEMRAGEVDEVDYDFYIQLASHLSERGWNERKRDREQAANRQEYRRITDPLEKHFHYEGTVDIPAMDDKEEAASLLDRMIGLLRGIPSRSAGEERYLAAAIELRASL